MSAAAHVGHGMGLEPVVSDWPALSATDVEQVLAHFPQVGTAQAIDWHSPRPFSAAAQVRAASGTFFVKRHHRRVREAQWLHEEHRFIAHLAAHAAPVIEPLRSGDGASALALGEWTYEVLPQAPGLDLYRDALSWTPFVSLTHARSAGATLAALHRAAQGFTAAPRTTPVLLANLRLVAQHDPLSAITAAVREQPALSDYLATHDWQQTVEDLHLPFHRELLPYLARQPALWTHNDWHASNLLWSADNPGAEVASVLDFGLSDCTFALYDLATALERNCVPWLDLDTGGQAAADLDAVEALLNGYHAVRPLSRDDLLTLAALLPVLHVDFALSEIAYFHGVVGSRASADVAYHAFLIGHTEWFRRAEGVRLLDHLRILARQRT